MIEQLRRLVDYNYWAHRRVWDCVMALTDEQFARPSDYSIGSVHAQIVHTMEVERLWLERAREVAWQPLPPPATYPTRTAIRERWDAIEADWRGYVAELTDEALNRPVEFSSLTDSKRRRILRWEAVMQCLNHSTDHRAQTLAIIHQAGGKTIAQDYIYYSWEVPAL